MSDFDRERFADEVFGQLEDEDFCSECGGLVEASKSCEQTDADGNRGQVFVSKECRHCGYYEDVATGLPCGRQF